MTAASPLSGIRVLDLGRFIAAPYCGLLLADMGAEVIRVERPGGDEDRRLGLTGPHGENFTFPGLARNKKGITLDLRQPEARRVLGDLIVRSDVFLHNFSPGAAAQLGLRYPEIRARRHDIIYTAVSCYGSEGPHAERPGFDPIAQTCSGAAALSGCDGDPPLRSGVPWVDYSTGLSAALGTLAALRHRDAAGEGQAVDCALLQTAVSFVAPMIAEAVVGGRERPRLGNGVPYVGPSDLFRCRDGFVYVACVTDGAWQSLTRLIGGPLMTVAGLSAWERFEQRAAIDPAVADWIGARTVAEVVDAMDRAHVPCGVYRSTAEVPLDPQVVACAMLPELDLEIPGVERLPVGAAPFRLSRSRRADLSRPPRVGEHNSEIYCGLLEYSPRRVADLQEIGAI